MGVHTNVWYGDDLARDLGFDGMSPDFWAWCDQHQLRPTVGEFGFSVAAVEEALDKAKVGVS